MTSNALDVALARAIVDTLREPIIILDEDLCVIAASRSFYKQFGLDHDRAQGVALNALSGGHWDIAALEALLRKIGPEAATLENYEVELDLPGLGHRIFILNARKVFYVDPHPVNILLAFEDVTERRVLERERDDLLVQKDLLLAEMQHRVANSLAIIASILMMKARSVASEETRAHLTDAHKRVMSVATVQQFLHTTAPGESINLQSYLSQLCKSLGESMINPDYCTIETTIGDGSVTSANAVSIGLIVTELVINSLKHAFPVDKPGCMVHVTYEMNGSDWKLEVGDNGRGVSTNDWPPPKTGLGTSIVSALAEQLGARVNTESGPDRTVVSITHSTFRSLPTAA